MKFNVLEVGSLVYVTCYGPFWGLKGIILAVDAIALADAHDPLYFYLVALHEGQTKEPLWFVHDHIAGVDGDRLAHYGVQTI